MNNKQRKTTLAVLAGLTLVVASIGSAFAQDGPQGGPGGPPEQGGPQGGPGMGGQGMGRLGKGGPGQMQGRRQGPPPPISLIFLPREMYDKLDLSDEEIEKIQTARQVFMEKHHPEQPKQGAERPTKEQMDSKRKEAEAAAEAADNALLPQLTDAHRTLVVKLLKDMKVLHSVHIPAGAALDLKLTDDQLAKLSAIAPKEGQMVDPETMKEKVDAILTSKQKRIRRSQGGRGMGGPGGPGGPGMGGPGGPGGPGGGPGMGGPGGPGGPDGGPRGGGDGGPGGPPPEDGADLYGDSI